MKSYILLSALLSAPFLSAMERQADPITYEEVTDLCQPFTPENELRLLLDTFSYVTQSLTQKKCGCLRMRCTAALDYYKGEMKRREPLLIKKIEDENELAGFMRRYVERKVAYLNYGDEGLVPSLKQDKLIINPLKRRGKSL